MKNINSIIFRNVFLLSIVVLFASWKAVGQSKDFKKKIKEADKAWNAGDIVKAKGLYENCHRIQPQNVECLKGLVEVFYFEQDYKKTHEYLTEYIPALETQIGIFENKPKLSGKEKKVLNRYKGLLADARAQLNTVKSNVVIEVQKAEEVARNEQLPIREKEKNEPPLNYGNNQNYTEQNKIKPTSSTGEVKQAVSEIGAEQKRMVRYTDTISIDHPMYTGATPEETKLDEAFKELEPDLYFAGSSVNSVKSQFVNDVISQTNGTIRSFNYNSVQNKNSDLYSLIKQQYNKKREQNKVLGDSLLLLTHKRNQLQLNLKQNELEISGLQVEKEAYKKIKITLKNKKNYYTEKRDAAKGENRTVKYYSNTLLLIQKLSNSGNVSIAQSIKVLDNLFDEYKGLAPYTVIQSKAIYAMGAN